ncbi:MAG: hypothetical protein AMJ79_08640 [Phycisphaerae bacterium SM23_30]|nr:MAG: hypothetical protein AMJ79_08640 [Phycisphaerae bacterium SM23_30]
MDNEEKMQYLANIYYLVRADGKVERMEEKLYDYIAKGIEAGYFESLKAKERAQKEGFTIKYPGRWSDRVRCVEDMLLAAYADKRLHELEQKILLQYANEIGIRKDQFKVIMDETKARLKELQGKVIF